MANDSSTRGLEIVTAFMLGLVSVVTALGAWQAAAWTGAAEELSRDSGDARDVSVNLSVIAEYARRIDREAVATAVYQTRLGEGIADPTESMLAQLRVDAALGTASESLRLDFPAWATSGFDPDAHPMLDPDYLIERDAASISYGQASVVAAGVADQFKAKSGVLAQAALIQALALFLFGISGVNRIRAVRAGVVVLGFVVFIGGLALAVTAY